jgi:hypothetical protein
MPRLAWIFLAGAVSVFLLCCWGFSVHSSTLQSQLTGRQDTVSEIVAKENAVWQAAKEKDLQLFSALLGDDALMIFTSGVVTKGEYLRSIAERNITSYALSNFSVFIPASDTAIVLYEATITGVFHAKPVTSYKVREASVWVRRSGKWVAVLNQETPMS